MMTEMRTNHVTEVRLLQRGLQNRAEEGSKNRVNETADLLDKLGKSIIQRDEAMKERSRLKAQMHQARLEIKTLQDERRKHINTAKKYQVQLNEAQKANAILMGEGGGNGRGKEEDDISDEEFEEELQNLERRYQVGRYFPSCPEQHNYAAIHMHILMSIHLHDEDCSSGFVGASSTPCTSRINYIYGAGFSKELI